MLLIVRRSARLGGALRTALVAALVALACSDPAAPVRVDAVTITAPRSVLLLGPGGGETMQLVATARDASGEAIEGRAVTWSIPGSGIVTVSTTGVVTAVGLGTIAVRATTGNVEATITLTVIPVPVAAVELPDAPIALVRSPVQVESVQLSPILRDSTGAVLPTRPVQWLSRAPSIVAVDNGGNLTPLAPGTSFVVASLDGRSDSAAVVVTVQTQLPGAADMGIVDVRWTQGAQNIDGTIPMLRGGRAAVAHIILQSPLSLAVQEEFVLRLFTSGGVLTWADTITATINAGTSSAEFPTAQVLVPSNRLLPGARWEVVRDPRGVIQDANAANDRVPQEGSAPLNLITPPLLRLRFVPIVLTSHGNVTGNVSAANLSEYLRVVRQFGPVGEIEAVVAPPFSSNASFGTAPSGGAGGFWVTLIQQLDAARLASPTDADAHWIAIVAPPPGFNFVTFGGMAYLPNDGTSFGPATRTMSLVNVNWFTRESQSRELVMHELGHNLGRQHAPCGGAGGPDPDYPNASGSIGNGGHDTWSFEVGATLSATPVDPNRGDIMGYCSPTWISSYNYGAVVSFRGSVDVAIQAPPVRTRVVLVQANVAGSVVTLERSLAFVGTPIAPESGGDWLVEGRDATGTVLFSHRTRLGRWDHLVDVRPLSVAIPLSSGVEAALDSITVIGPRGERASRAFQSAIPR